MAKYSKGQIDRAGNVLKDINSHTFEEVAEAKDILTYWRFIHTPVINGFQAMLRNKISGEYKKMGFIAQRLKRTPSIVFKLEREKGMRLCRMQDIAGIRAVMKKLSDVNLLVDDLKNSRHKHKLVYEVDYITNPKETGYRSIHLIFEYNNLRQPDSSGLKIEVQVRTRLQHLWATAVETLGTFLNISLKSGYGDPEILNFFALASSAFAIVEKCPILKIHNYPTSFHLFHDVVKRFDELKIRDKLNAYSVAAQEAVKVKKAKYFLVILDTYEKSISITGYSGKRLSQANIDYTQVEMDIDDDSSREVVLVSIDKISALKAAYPNYFLDANHFIGKIDALREMVSKNKGAMMQLTLNF